MSFKASVNRFFSNKYLAYTITFIIFILVTLPSEKIEFQAFEISDKAAHFIVFATWAFCWMGAFGKYTQTILLGFLYGILIECWQSVLPEAFHRNFDLYDALADSIGVLIGVSLWKMKTLFERETH
jgi:VanZ family protein